MAFQNPHIVEIPNGTFNVHWHIGQINNYADDSDTLGHNFVSAHNAAPDALHSLVPGSRPPQQPLHSFSPQTPTSDSSPFVLPSSSTKPILSARHGHNQSASTSSGSLQLAASFELPLVSQAPNGSIEAATLAGLIEWLIADFSSVWSGFQFCRLSFRQLVLP
jgi:hypothetical protein